MRGGCSWSIILDKINKSTTTPRSSLVLTNKVLLTMLMASHLWIINKVHLPIMFSKLPRISSFSSLARAEMDRCRLVYFTKYCVYVYQFLMPALNKKLHRNRKVVHKRVLAYPGLLSCGVIPMVYALYYPLLLSLRSTASMAIRSTKSRVRMGMVCAKLSSPFLHQYSYCTVCNPWTTLISFSELSAGYPGTHIHT